MSMYTLFLLLTFLIFTENGGDAASPDHQPPQHHFHKPSPTNSKHFVLVHGACHGAWSWYKLVPLLKSSGHNVTVLDMAASGVHPQHVRTLQSVSDYFRPLMDYMASLPRNQRVILVGHSFGGLGLSRAMEEFPHRVHVAVFLTAFMPGPTFNTSFLYKEFFKGFGPQLDNRVTFNNGDNTLPATIIFGPRFISSRLYQLSPIEDSTLATTLMRQMRLLSEEDMAKEFKLSKQRHGSVKRVFIVADKDLTIKKDFQHWMVQNNPPNETIEIVGSDHMVMMSKPTKLWACLMNIAHKYD